MELESDHSNSDHPATSTTAASDEQNHALIAAAKEQLAADLAQAKSVIEASEREIAGRGGKFKN
jgi:hypothetical protein